MARKKTTSKEPKTLFENGVVAIDKEQAEALFADWPLAA